MSVINLPPMLKQIIGDLEKRVRKLEQPNTFAVPSQTTNPQTTFDGMIWYRLSDKKFMTQDNGTVRPLGECKNYASVGDVTTQAFVNSASVQQILIGTSYAASGVSLASNALTVTYAGTYTVHFSVQLTNADTTTEHDAYVWMRKNGSDVADSNSSISVAKKHSGVNGAGIMTVPLTLTLAAGDALTFYWWSDSTQMSIATIAAGAAPVYPRTPGVLATVTQIAW